MSIRCWLGFHALEIQAPCFNRCARCKQAFFTDYFESRARGYCVRFPVSEQHVKEEFPGKELDGG